jgi:hypothetical protein
MLWIPIRDPVLFYPLDGGSGSGMNFFRIRDELFFLTAPEAIRSKEKGCFYFTSLFLRRILDPG